MSHSRHPIRFLFCLALGWVLLHPAAASAQVRTADQIIAIVNEKIILKSDVDLEVANYLQQSRLQGMQIEFSQDLWFQALESMIDNEVMLVQAEIDSIVVSDDQVNRQMDMRIAELEAQAGGEAALERAFGKSLPEIRREFRDQFREQMTVSQLQSAQITKVGITRPEVEEFFDSIPADSLPLIPEMVAVSQIVIKPEPSKDVRMRAMEQAQAIRDSIVDGGASFEEMARRHSQGPSAPRGGLIPLIPLNDLVAEYAAAASALEPGEVSEVVETEFGFHVIRLNRRQGDRIETNNILIRLDSEQFDDQGAIARLDSLRTQVMEEDRPFDELAREISEDEDTAPSGGRLYDPGTGERLIPIERLDPALYRIVLLLTQEGMVSEPRPFNLPGGPGQQTRAFRIVRLDRLIPEHVANLKQDYARIEQIALQRKQAKELGDWLDEIRENVYIEYLIDLPSRQGSAGR